MIRKFLWPENVVIVVNALMQRLFLIENTEIDRSYTRLEALSYGCLVRVLGVFQQFSVNVVFDPNL